MKRDKGSPAETDRDELERQVEGSGATFAICSLNTTC